MKKEGFRLLADEFTYCNRDLALKGYYKQWRLTNRNAGQPFVALYNSFREVYLKELDGGALRLYLFLSFAAKNDAGHSWYSIQSIAAFFGTQTRTIDNWIKTLVEKELIYREQTNKKSNTTYLIPYSDSLIGHSPPKKVGNDGQRILDFLIDTIVDLSSVYGEIVKVYHLFQWKGKNKEPDKNRNSQYFFVITKRSNGVLTGHRCKLNDLHHQSISELNIEYISTFTSPFQFKNDNILGLALPHTIQFITGNTDVFLDLMKKLVTTSDPTLSEHPTVGYGNKDQVLELNEVKEKETRREE